MKQVDGPPPGAEAAIGGRAGSWIPPYFAGFGGLTVQNPGSLATTLGPG
jgi:hypothetical protein